MQNKTKLLAALAAITLLVSVSGCGTAAATNHVSTNTATSLNLPTEPKYSGPIVATYQGGALTKAELDAQYNLQVTLFGAQNTESKEAFLKYYIVWYKYLYAKAAASAKSPVNPSAAEQAVVQTMQQLVGTQYRTQQDVINKLSSMNLSETDLLVAMEKGQILQQYLESQMRKVTVSDKTAEAYYNQHKSDYIQVTVDQILVSSKSQAEQIEAQLKAGANFATLADKYSADPSVKQNHGHFANALVGEFVPQFAQACRTLPIGQISDPVESQYGYHILRVDSRKQLTYAEAASAIKQQLLPQAQQAAEQSLYNNALQEADIHIVAKPQDL